ncbi:MAG TPA: aldo/keto reductase [Burkholderiales bacterium]|jgi:aryl-alcohol dehydrogenase-like predicted oxidoreductase
MNQATQPAASAGTIRLGELTVNRMGFGAMRVAGPGIWGEPGDRAAMRRLLARAFELGHNFLDTADSYGPDVSEILIAEALYPYPQGLVIGTKGGLTRPSRSRWDEDGRPEHLRRAVDGSLKKLRIDRIDLYQFHAPDPRVPYSESIGALAELQRAGKIRHLGVSNVSVKQLEVARRIAPIVSVQNEYNIANRKDDDVLAACEKAGLAFIPWYPLGAGTVLRSARVERVAERLRVTTAQVAIAWLLARSPVMLPIPGTASIAHLEENAAAGRLVLSPEDLSALTRV